MIRLEGEASGEDLFTHLLDLIFKLALEVYLENHIPSLLTSLITSVKLLHCKLEEENTWVYLGTSQFLK